MTPTPEQLAIQTALAPLREENDRLKNELENRTRLTKGAELLREGLGEALSESSRLREQVETLRGALEAVKSTPHWDAVPKIVDAALAAHDALTRKESADAPDQGDIVAHSFQKESERFSKEHPNWPGNPPSDEPTPEHVSMSYETFMLMKKAVEAQCEATAAPQAERDQLQAELATWKRRAEEKEKPTLALGCELESTRAELATCRRERDKYHAQFNGAVKAVLASLAQVEELEKVRHALNIENISILVKSLKAHDERDSAHAEISRLNTECKRYADELLLCQRRNEEMEKKCDRQYELGWSSVMNSWLRSLGDKLYMKSHTIDACAKTTELLVADRNKAESERDSLRAQLTASEERLQKAGADVDRLIGVLQLAKRYVDDGNVHWSDYVQEHDRKTVAAALAARTEGQQP